MPEPVISVPAELDLPEPARVHALNRGRFDWRFLLPEPPLGAFQHLILLGGSPELAAQMIEAGFAQHMSCHVPPQQTADALIMLAHSQVPFAEAVPCLQPGGVFYGEVDRRAQGLLATMPARRLRALRQAGLTPTGLYWVAPNFVTPKRYLPLDVPGVLHWYVRTLFVAGTPQHRLVEMGLRTLARHHGQFAQWVPCYSITAIAGSAPPSAPSLLAHAELPIELQQPDVRPLVLTSGQDSASRAIILPFARHQPHPLAVIKVSPLAGVNDNTSQEQAALASLQARLDPAMRATIPRPLGVLRYGKLAAGIESYAPGQTLWASSGRWGVPLPYKIRDLETVTAWLSEFHQQLQVRRMRWDADAIDQWVTQPLAAYARIFTLNREEEQLFALAKAWAHTLMNSTLPIVAVHGDMGPWNLYRADEQLTVIDWEAGQDTDAQRAGLPLADLLYFITHWYYLVHQLYGEAAELEGFRRLFAAPTPEDESAQAAQRVLAAYMTQLGMDARFLPLLLVCTWVNHALGRHQRQQQLHQQPGAQTGLHARTANRYVMYITLLAQAASVIFPPTGQKVSL